MTCPVSFAAVLGSAPVASCTAGSRWTDSCSPLGASCAPERGDTRSADPSRPGPVLLSALSCREVKQTLEKERKQDRDLSRDAKNTNTLESSLSGIVGLGRFHVLFWNVARFHP